MAQVKIEEVIDHLSAEMKKALADAVIRALPDAKFDSGQLFREFKRAVGRRCSTWETVPDRFIKE